MEEVADRRSMAPLNAFVPKTLKEKSVNTVSKFVVTIVKISSFVRLLTRNK